MYFRRNRPRRFKLSPNYRRSCIVSCVCSSAGNLKPAIMKGRLLWYIKSSSHVHRYALDVKICESDHLQSNLTLSGVEFRTISEPRSLSISESQNIRVRFSIKAERADDRMTRWNVKWLHDISKQPAFHNSSLLFTHWRTYTTNHTLPLQKKILNFCRIQGFW